jgi:hypothetical protein
MAGVFKGRQLSGALGLALLILMPMSFGCRTGGNPAFTTSGPGWRLREGQALWCPKKQMPEIGGELLVASHEDGRCLTEFSKSPLTLAVAQSGPIGWSIKFPPAGMSFSGAGKPPQRFLWLYLNAALAGKSLPKQIHFQRNSGDRWRLENIRTGESMEGYLAP